VRLDVRDKQKKGGAVPVHLVEPMIDQPIDSTRPFIIPLIEDLAIETIDCKSKNIALT
jgi:hypothetical protein